MLVAVRVGIAAVILNLLLAATGRRLPPSSATWRAFLAMGALNNSLPFYLIVWDQTHIVSGLAAILNATTPLFTVLLAYLLTRDERMTRNKTAGVLVGFAGVAVMLGPSLLAEIGTDALAQFAVLAVAVCCALAGIFRRRFGAMGVSPLVTAAGQVTSSTALLLPRALAVDHPWELSFPGPATVAAVLDFAILSTSLAYLPYFRLLATAGATNLLLLTFLIPVSAISLGVLVFGERLTPQHFAGMAMICAGLAAIDGRVMAGLRQRGGTPAS